MNVGLVKYDWNEIENFSEEEITYFLFLEGKSAEAISKIRNIDKAEVQRHIIEGKIKYRMLAKSKDVKALFSWIAKAGKADKIAALQDLDEETGEELFEYIRENYTQMGPMDKEAAVWMIGEKREKSCKSVLIKASVHNQVGIRRMAVSAMGKLGDPEMELPLLRALEDSNPQVVLYSIKALTKIEIHRREVIAKIRNIYENTDKEYIKRSAKEFLSSNVEEAR